MPSNPAFEPGREIAFYCTVSGASAVKPVVTQAQVCALFKRRFDTALGQITRAGAGPSASANAIRVAVRISDNRSASAAITTTARGKSTRWPEISVDVMDKSLGIRELEQLAGAVARSISHSR
jgi:hypothetical protein